MLENVFEIVDGVIEDYDGQEENVTIPEEVEVIGEYAFSGASVISVTIPEGVTRIEDGAFSDCNSLTTITIPASVKYIGEAAFSNCCALKQITLPEGLETLERDLFLGCDNLTCITIPESVRKIERNAFQDCVALTQVNFPQKMPHIHNFAFMGCKGLADQDGFVIFNDILFDYVGRNPEIKIPYGVKVIGNFSFPSSQHCVYCVTIPDSVTEIGEKAFAMAEPMLLTIPDSVTKIGENAFSCVCFTACVSAGSYAQQYAQENEIVYILAKDQPQSSGRKSFWERFGKK